MPLASSAVADDQTATAAQYNNLREDVITNHDHGGTGGSSVDHADLSESGAMTGKYHTHTNIEAHMNGTDESFDDTPGGALGVHGLGASTYVAGMLDAQYVIKVGSATPTGGGDPTYHSVTVNTGLASIVYVNASTTSNANDHPAFTMNISGGDFDIKCLNSALCYWIAIGSLS